MRSFNIKSLVVTVGIAIGFFLIPEQVRAVISWHEENGYGLETLQNEQSPSVCSEFESQISVTDKEIMEFGIDINNPLAGQPGGEVTLTCLNCGPGASIANDSGSDGLPMVSYGLLTWDTTQVNLQDFVQSGARFRVSARVGTEVIYGALCIKVNGGGGQTTQGSQLSWTDKVINVANASSPLICQDDKLIGEVRVGEKKKIIYETSLNNTNNLDITFSCLNCGVGATFTKKSNTAATLEWDTTNVDLTQFSRGRATFQVFATAGGNNSVVGSACARVIGLCEKPDSTSCAATSGCIWLPVGRCVMKTDTSVKCAEINDQAVCTSVTHCRFDEDTKKCLGKNQVEVSKAIDNYIAERYKAPDGYEGPLPPCAFTGSCRNVEDLVELGVNVATWLFGIIAGLGFAFFVYGGLTMVLSFGNSEKVVQGKQILVAATVGMIIAFSAYVLVNFIVKAIGITS
ncbi:MAG: hypothetical protein KBD29_02315 [Candidatus Magasanikbacteria bacterium]|nr:hypothetical protein [Candidatus Magasanikbacteria bacterium]